jgi:UDP-N-acetylglucosamine transferase subunit ALG13
MIFVTVGGQMPFDRLIRAVDQWAEEHQRTDIFAQIGPTDYEPSFIKWVKYLDSAAFSGRLDSADAIISHAGMGTILSALYRAKPILVFPRRGDLMETRNDHQVDTAKRFVEMGMVRAAYDELELREELGRIDDLKQDRRIGPHASPELVTTLRDFINADPETVRSRPASPVHATAPRDISSSAAQPQ